VARAGRAEGFDVFAVFVELLDPVVAGVGDPDVVVGVDRDDLRSVELAAAGAGSAREKEELRSIVLLSAWEVIRRYPLERRPRRVAANLLLDTLKATLIELGRESEWSAIRSFATIEGEASSAPEEIDRDVDGLLERAVAAGALTSEEAEAILSSRFDGTDLAELARGAGISYNAMKMRRQRAERRLIVFLGYRPVPRGQQNRPARRNAA
jgi:DNA-directed RNA polymerase specialized sigma24 family protein